MLRKSLSLAPVFAMLLTLQGLAGEKEVKEFKPLEGTWEITELIVGGEKVPEKEISGLKFVFSVEMEKDMKAHKLTLIPPMSDSELIDKRTFSLKFSGTAVTATALDGRFKGTSSPAIFEVKGDVLRWCQSDDEKATERPKEFVSPAKSRIYLFTFKKAK